MFDGVEEKDAVAEKKRQYILSRLKDIHEKADLDDERVLVFCQPVYNIHEECFDTAEALMRLKLEETGMVFPDQFIPLAEEHDYIHTMSRIILHKTCVQIRNLLDAGFNVKRISVNFSISELHDENFCKEVEEIIGKTGIPYEKVAIELTETQDESDFLMVKSRIESLQSHGIKLYLDDFGTWYSNFLRIMELPFDIIKFDRSLVIAAMNSIKSETIVSYLAHMFSDMNYSVLYEGIETEEDEKKCIRMCARYLQGYKYSKPIPIEQLTEYFGKSA
ncbi:MAG: EAL domain-containing protein [Lachnospiraceae bacterium]|nr:EAL domain-containing protein [Lachnospiraceae bacterium]